MRRSRRRPNLFDVTIAAHRRLLELSDALADPPPGPAAPVRRWRSAAQRLVVAEARHELAEEQYLWPVVRDVLDGGDQLARAGRRQERDAKRALVRLDRAAGRGEPLDDLLPPLVADLRAHVAFEESQVLPSLRVALSQELADRLGSLLLQAAARAPTRPRPKLPAAPGLLRMSAPVLGRGDRLADFLTQRGR